MRLGDLDQSTGCAAGSAYGPCIVAAVSPRLGGRVSRRAPVAGGAEAGVRARRLRRTGGTGRRPGAGRMAAPRCLKPLLP